jgi:elongation factor Ts
MISAAQVRALREKTDLPMMECKQALTECSGNEQAAIEWLRKRHKGKMDERAHRETGEGRIFVYIDDAGKTGAIIDLRCETAPVAKNEQFCALGDKIARHVASQADSAPSPQSVLDASSVTDPNKTVNDLIADTYGRLRETIKLAACRKLTGEYLCSYVHHDGKKGVLIALDAAPSPQQVGIDLCQHVTFTQPLAITREEIPAAELEKVRTLARELAESEGKPSAIIDKIVQGKVNAFCTQHALMDQEHVKPEYEKKKVRDALKAGGVQAVLDIAYMRIGA